MKQVQKKLKRLKLTLSALLFLLFILTVSLVFILTGLAINQVALAISGNYSKATGDQLTVADWNNLDNDFLPYTGATGQLDMNSQRIVNMGPPGAAGDAANKQYVDLAVTAAGGSITDVSGNSLKMVCGNTVPGATNWLAYDPNTIYTTVDTSAAGFLSNAYYLTGLGGDTNHWDTTGVQNIYPPVGLGQTLANAFRTYIYKPGGITPAQANSSGYRWYVIWCGVAQ